MATGIAAIHKQVVKLMGNRFEISVVDDSKDSAGIHMDAAIEEIRRIEALLTTYSETSQTALINRQAGLSPVRVDEEVYSLIERSLKISQLTQGAFDITYGSIDKSLWNFDKTMTALPDAATAKALVRLINYRNVLLDAAAGTVFLKERGMRIGFGGIGKGYAADRAKAVLRARGVESGIVNASGDLTAWGTQPNGSPWTIGIVHPDAARQPFSSLSVSGKAVATSGNYEKFIVIGGKKYSHTIDPKTGLPVRGVKSVTIISPSAELSDAMATPVMIMGVEAGLYLLNQLKQLACIIIDDENKIHKTANIKFV